MRGLKSTPWAAIGALLTVLALLGSCLAADSEDDKSHEQLAGTSTTLSRQDDEILKRLDLSALSKLRISTRKLPLKTKCLFFAESLREMLDEADEDHVELYAKVADALSKKKLPFGNVSPVMKVLNDCHNTLKSGYEIDDGSKPPESSGHSSSSSDSLENDLVEDAHDHEDYEINQQQQHQEEASHAAPVPAATATDGDVQGHAYDGHHTNYDSFEPASAGHQFESSPSSTPSSNQQSLLESELAEARRLNGQLELELANSRAELEALKSSQRQSFAPSTSGGTSVASDLKQQYEQALERENAFKMEIDELRHKLFRYESGENASKMENWAF